MNHITGQEMVYLGQVNYVHVPSKTVIKYFATNYFKYDICAIAVGDLFHSFSDVFLVVVYTFYGSLLFDKFTFVCAPTGSNYLSLQAYNNKWIAFKWIYKIHCAFLSNTFHIFYSASINEDLPNSYRSRRKMMDLNNMRKAGGTVSWTEFGAMFWWKTAYMYHRVRYSNLIYRHLTWMTLYTVSVIKGTDEGEITDNPLIAFLSNIFICRLRARQSARTNLYCFWSDLFLICYFSLLGIQSNPFSSFKLL